VDNCSVNVHNQMMVYLSRKHYVTIASLIYNLENIINILTIVNKNKYFLIKLKINHMTDVLNYKLKQ
jgi:hypothetical protein